MVPQSLSVNFELTVLFIILVPEKVWHLLEPEKPVEVTLDALCENEEDELWWNQKELTNLDLSSNSLSSISSKIENLHSLTVLNVSYLETMFNHTFCNIS